MNARAPFSSLLANRYGAEQLVCVGLCKHSTATVWDWGQVS